MSETQAERRCHPRLAEAVTGHIFCHSLGGKVRVTGRNISCSGILCHVSHYIPPFTQLALALELPKEDGGEILDLEGVVVRIEPEEPEEGREDYEAAVFFPTVGPKARERIGRFIVEHGPDGEG